jgi:hypothetical protein
MIGCEFSSLPSAICHLLVGLLTTPRGLDLGLTPQPTPFRFEFPEPPDMRIGRETTGEEAVAFGPPCVTAMEAGEVCLVDLPKALRGLFRGLDQGGELPGC